MITLFVRDETSLDNSINFLVANDSTPIHLSVELSSNYKINWVAKKKWAILLENTRTQSLSLLSGNYQNFQTIIELLKKNQNLLNLSLSDLRSEQYGTIFKSDQRAINILASFIIQNNVLQTINLCFSVFLYKQIEIIATALEKNKSIQSLNLSYCKFDDQATELIAKALKQNKSIQSLNLSCCDLGDKKTEVIAKALEKNSIKNLDLSGNNISEQFTTAFLKFLRGNQVLNVLKLENNNITFVWGRALYLELIFEANKSIQELDLSYNPIKNQGLKVILQSLINNQVLEKLNLQHTHINDEGILEVAPLLEKNKYIKILNLGCNSINYAGAKAIAKVLRTNQILQDLDLARNDIDDRGAEEIAQALKNNTVMKNLSLSGNNITNQGLNSLVELLISKKLLFSPAKEDDFKLKIQTFSLLFLDNGPPAKSIIFRSLYSDDNIKDIMGEPPSIEEDKQLEPHVHNFRVMYSAMIYITRGKKAMKANGEMSPLLPSEIIKKIVNTKFNFLKFKR